MIDFHFGNMKTGPSPLEVRKTFLLRVLGELLMIR